MKASDQAGDEADRDHVAAADCAQLLERENRADDGENAEESAGDDHPEQRSAQPRLGQRRRFSAVMSRQPMVRA